MSQYFQLFRLPETFELDLAALEQTYRTLAAQFHPDKFAAASAFEQKQAVMMSATINQAYTTLKHPIDRAAYLLKQQNIDADAPENTSFAPEFLTQQMEWREALAEANMENDTAALQKLHDEIAAEYATLQNQLAESFRLPSYETAADQVRQGRFLSKMLRETEVALDK
ncbi:Fe-S protein assembly co-chaperone HscB [Kingella negevensis]|uniref:Fe-S protein assembly co-chaperone HscB n=1 Tax=Kingella negevensis TaxID=1522312 RepID=UPI002542DA13|nr:Fe-S protein assembly co-chaperone HscB [Kingella negevensis]WII94037.1 Fe-S protein assembly co-chaperone HscB [Kingella negevensis]